MKQYIPILGLLAAPTLWAATPAQLMAGYSAGAVGARADFAADAGRGKAFAERDWNHSSRLASCTSCHTDNPRSPGKHAITGKRIAPLSPAVNPKRFTDAAKVEKWFKRNCREVVGRTCTAAEKADFIAFASGVH